MKEIDKNALLEEAKRRYPIGTKFKSVNDKEIYKVETNSHRWCNEGIDVEGVPWIYLRGNWAEIVEEPKVETKFEKGKWYHSTDWGRPNDYIKFSEFESPNTFYFTEKIHGGEYKVLEDYWNCPENTIKEVPLSEIQQYLPTGHPDKFTTPIAKEEFVLPEKWCVKVTDENREIIHTWKINNTSFSSFTKAGNYVFKEGTWENTILDHIEITFDQFKKYVLKDGIKEEVKKDKNSDITWKIGDYIVFTVDWCSSKRGDVDRIKNLGDIIEAIHLEKEGLAGSPLYIDCKLKVFPTLQEAQKFSDELLGKSKSSLGVEDLVKGEIYYTKWKDGTNEHIFKFLGGTYSDCENLCIRGNNFTKGARAFNTDYIKNLRIATTSEKKWLNTCIKQDKFIPKEDLDKYDDEGNWMESKKYPEYVKYIKGDDINKVVKVIKWTSHSYCCVEFSDGTYKEPFKHLVEPSTKEAYEAQFNKNGKFKDGDWLVYIKDCGFNPSIPIKIGDIRQMIRGSFGTLTIYGAEDLSQYFRKALPHEIPFEISCTTARYVIGIDPVSDLKATLSIDDEELPMVRPSKEIKITNKLTID